MAKKEPERGRSEEAKRNRRSVWGRPCPSPAEQDTDRGSPEGAILCGVAVLPRYPARLLGGHAGLSDKNPRCEITDHDYCRSRPYEQWVSLAAGDFIVRYQRWSHLLATRLGKQNQGAH